MTASRLASVRAESSLGTPLVPRRESSCFPSEGDVRSDMGRQQLDLTPLVANWPEMHPPASRLRVAGQELRALLGRTDADLPAEFRRVALQKRCKDLVQNSFLLRP